MRSLVYLLAAIVLLCVVNPVLAEGKVKVAVYVLAQDAKFIGDYTGGVEINVFHRDSGELLAQGITKGTTGDTDQIMQHPQPSSKISKDAAFFLAVMAIEQATPVRIEATGPLAYPQAQQTISTTTWIYPQQTIKPLVLSMPGYIVEGEFRMGKQNHLFVAARVRMLCGCGLSPNGYWRSGETYVWAELYRGNDKVASVELKFNDNSSYVATVDISEYSTWQPDRLVINARAKDGLHTGRWTEALTLR